MLSKYVQPGSKCEIRVIERFPFSDTSEKKTVYASKVCDIISEDRLELIMPMENAQWIFLPVNTEYELCFYTRQKQYQCFGRIIDRYKENTRYLLLMELTSNLRKFQRREYYRFSCALEMYSQPLDGEKIDPDDMDHAGEMSPGLPLQRSVVVDISGGGLRFVSNYAYQPDMVIRCRYYLTIDGKNKEYNLMGKVLDVKELAHRPGMFEHRVQYIDVDTEEREEIIRFIFEEERKSRKRESGGFR